MIQVIKAEIIGLLDLNLDGEDLFNFLRRIKIDAENIIEVIPEVRQKRKMIKVIFSPSEGKKKIIEGDQNVIGRVIRVDIRERIKGEKPLIIQKIAIEAVVDAVLKELPSIQASPGMFGMRLSKLTEIRLTELLRLYEKIVGGKISQYVFSESSEPISEKLKYIRETLECTNAAEMRFGSNLDGGEENAKFFVWRVDSIVAPVTKIRDEVIKFAFDPNVVHGNEADQMQWNFEEAVDELLVKWKVNIKL